MPRKGPVIFAVAPHANQFVDPMMLLVTCGRKVGFLTAKKSMDKFWIGMFARAFNSIPVIRPQDLAQVGIGKIHLSKDNPLKLFGKSTNFTKQMGKRYLITLASGESSEVAEVINHNELLLSREFSSDASITLLTSTDKSGNFVGTEYKITPHVDQSSMFNEVVSRLVKRGAIGIFPEGGSHDRPNMLPLKPGVSMMVIY